MHTHMHSSQAPDLVYMSLIQQAIGWANCSRRELEKLAGFPHAVVHVSKRRRRLGLSLGLSPGLNSGIELEPELELNSELELYALPKPPKEGAGRPGQGNRNRTRAGGAAAATGAAARAGGAGRKAAGAARRANVTAATNRSAASLGRRGAPLGAKAATKAAAVQATKPSKAAKAAKAAKEAKVRNATGAATFDSWNVERIASGGGSGNVNGNALTNEASPVHSADSFAGNQRLLRHSQGSYSDHMRNSAIWYELQTLAFLPLSLSFPIFPYSNVPVERLHGIR